MKNLFNNFLKITLIVTMQFAYSSCTLLEIFGFQASENKADSTKDLTYDGQPADMTKPVKVFILMGQSNMVGAGAVEPDGKEGTLANATMTKGLYQHLLNPDKSWTVRKDVRNVFAMASGSDPWEIHKNDWLTADDTTNIGPELGFGYIMGQHFDEPVLILKSCIGNRSLGFDLLPPGSVQHEYDGYTYGGFGDAEKWLTGSTMPDPGSWPAGIQYAGDTKTAKDVLADLGTYYPGATKYEIAGFVFWQGDKDRYDGGHASRYEKNLVNFIKALRKDFNAPNAPFVCATLGQTRKGATGNDALIFDAQLAVDGDNGKYPEFARNVATVYSYPLSMGGSSNGHYNGNAETYENVGEAMGWAMVKLLNQNNVESIKITPSNPSVALGNDQQFAATAYYSDGFTEDITNTVIWTSADTGVATINETGLAESLAEGSTIITADYNGKTVNTLLTVTAKALDHITISPLTPSVALGIDQQFIATAHYSDASTDDVTASTTWTSSDTGVAAIDGSGLAETLLEGSTTITAYYNGETTNTTLIITAKVLDHITISPLTPLVALGSDQSFTATAHYSDGSTDDVTASTTWTSSDTAVATIDGTGLGESLAEGTTTITADYSGETANTLLTVTAKALDHITISPLTPSVTLGIDQQFAATAHYSDGSTDDVTASTTWNSSDTVVATIDGSGLAESLLEGSTTITADYSGETTNTILIITAKVLDHITISPTDPSVALGIDPQFTATAHYSDDSTDDVTASTTWTSSDTAVATIDGTGLGESLAEGTTTITADYSGETANTVLTVTAIALDHITISPIDPSVSLGNDQSFTATAHYSDGSTDDVTMLVTWSSTSPDIATISNILGTNGLATVQTIGTTMIEAEFEGIFGSTNLTVTAAALETIIVTPANDSIAGGLTLQYTATGTYADGSTEDITTSVTWSSSNTGVATVDNSGLATGQNTGSTTITATVDTISGSGTLTVSAPVVMSITITPANDTIEIGSNLQYTAMATYSDSSSKDITNSVTWSSTNIAYATISNSSGSEGLAAGVTAGATKISATLGAVSDSTILTVKPPPWWELEVTTTGVNQNMTIGFDGPAYMTIDWGDSTVQTTTSTSETHTYSSPGIYILRLKGSASRIYFNNANAQARLTRILSVVQGVSRLISFNYTFADCTNLTGEIPAGLFDNCPFVTDFSSVFRNCSGLTGSIPAGLFDNCPKVEWFRAAFIRCSGLTGPIPAGLFDNNPLAWDFLNTFQSCSGLTAIPDGLFDNNPNAANFHYTFQNCTGLTYVPSDLFDKTPLVRTFQQTFSNCTGITSSVPELWVDTATRFPNLDLPISKYVGGCFWGVSNASNWIDIPTLWGGP